LHDGGPTQWAAGGGCREEERERKTRPLLESEKAQMLLVGTLFFFLRGSWALNCKRQDKTAVAGWAEN